MYICSMITFIIAFTVTIVAIADIVAYRRLAHRISSAAGRIALACAIIIADTLPYTPLALMLLFSDNSTATMHITMWALTLYTLLTLPRIGLYIWWLPAKGRRANLIAGICTAAAIFGVLIYGVVKTRNDVEVRNVEMSFDNLPSAFDGYRIALFSDVHIGTMLNPQKECRRVVEAINMTHADAVLFGGDLVNIRHTELTPQIARALEQVRSRDGVYAILGNHDRGVYIKDSVRLSLKENTERLAEQIRDMGWQLLRDSVAYIHRGADSIAIVGIDFSDALLDYKHSFDTPENLNVADIFRPIPDSTFRITLSHLPQVWHLLRGENHSDLTLAGHVHASQIKFRCLGKSLSPAMLMYKEWSGLYEEQGSRLYINDGIGAVGFFMRLGARPEITVIELKRE